MKYVLRKQYTAADALSRRPRHPDDTRSSEEEDINDWILSELSAYEIYPIELESDLSEDD